MRSNFLGWKSYLVFGSFYDVTEKSKLLLYTGCPDGFAFFYDVKERMTTIFLRSSYTIQGTPKDSKQVKLCISLFWVKKLFGNTFAVVCCGTWDEFFFFHLWFPMLNYGYKVKSSIEDIHFIGTR